MKIAYTFLLFLFMIGATSCLSSEQSISLPANEQEVELTILTFSSSPRASVNDPGIARERQIDELDLLIFKDNKFQYSRRAMKFSGNRYKANLKIDNATLTAYVFANYRTALATWEESDDQEDKSWEAVQAELIDFVPSRLVSNAGEVLPMCGKTSGTVSETQVSGWGDVKMLRSVASVDAYIEQNIATEKFILTDAHLYYAPDKGFIAPEFTNDGYKSTSPGGMQTLLNTLQASNTSIVSMEIEPGVTVVKDAIANQLYLYDNDITSENFSPDTAPIRKYTRLILAGYYDQPNADPDPESGKDRRVKTYYPLDFVDENGQFHDIKRNYKYVFNIGSVNGEGYGSLEEAADEYPINMDVEVIEWNRQDEHIGIQGKYYLSMERKDAFLWSKEGATDELKLTYEILDNTPGETFAITFTSDSNGTQTPPTGTSPWPDTIRNDYFKVSLIHDAAIQTANFIVQALQDHAYEHSTDRVEVRFRDLKFYISITQLDKNGWDEGGEIPAEI